MGGKQDGDQDLRYANGKRAVCVAANNTLCFDEKGSLVAALDEQGSGFVRGSVAEGVALVLNPKGGLLREKGMIKKEWRWDPVMHKQCGAPPPSLCLQPGKHFIFEMTARDRQTITFSQAGRTHTLEVGLRSKPFVSQPRITLVKRNIMHCEDMALKRDLLKPQSKNMAGELKDMVGRLESCFDGLEPSVEPFLGFRQIKEDALQATQSELPRIKASGGETGPMRGFGATLYQDAPAASSLEGSRFMAEGTGKWKGELEISQQLHLENPELPRSAALQQASGRYAREIVVNKSKRSESNPTGGTEKPGKQVRRVDAARFGSYVATHASTKRLLLVVAVRSGGDCTGSCKAVVAAEVLNGSLQEEDNIDMVVVDVGGSNALAERYNLRSVPSFMIMMSGAPLWSGQAGGAPLKISPAQTLKVLLVEPSFKQQILTEKVLRKSGCQWHLAMNQQQAMAQRAVLGGFYDVVLLSTNELPEQESVELARAMRGGGSLVVAMVGPIAFGCLSPTFTRNGIAWTGLGELVPEHVANEVDAVVSKPLRSVVMSEVAAHRAAVHVNKSRSHYIGFTPEELKSRCDDVLGKAKAGFFKGPSCVASGILTPCAETSYKGIALAS